MKKSAFTLIECICALIVTSLVVIMMSFIMVMIRQSTVGQADQPLDWYLCLAELESPDHQFEITRVNNIEARLTSQLNNRQYLLRGREHLYLTMADRPGGFLPLFDDIKPASFYCRRLNNHQLEVRIQRKNGQVERGIVRLNTRD